MHSNAGNAGDCVERDNGPVKNNTKHASRFKVKNNGKSIRKEKNGKSLNSSKSISANESNSKKQGIATKQITMMTPCQESASITLAQFSKAGMGNDINQYV